MGVYKKDNRWMIDYYLSDGKRRREVVKIKGIDPNKITRQDALKALSIRKAQIAEGKFDIAQTMKPVLFDKLVNVFMEDYSKANKRSWKRDRTSCRALLGFFTNKKITQITPWLVDKYKSKRLTDTSRYNRPLSKATINRELACLKTMLNYAVGEGWLPSNPIAGYKLFKEKLTKLRVVTRDEFNIVYNTSSDELKPILIMAYHTGMRRSEILSLKWENVSLSESYIRVEESKNDESRYIPINKELNIVLKSVKYQSSGEYVFSHDEEPVKCFKTAFYNAVERSGVKKFTFHDLRHTFASNLVMRGVDIITVSELLGHKSLSMTKRYSHPTPEHKRRAVETLVIDTMDTYLDTKHTTSSAEANVSA